MKQKILDEIKRRALAYREENDRLLGVREHEQYRSAELRAIWNEYQDFYGWIKENFNEQGGQ